MMGHSHPCEGWFEEADKFLTHIHRGLALAHGGRLQVPRADRVYDASWEITFFAATGYSSELPVQYHLNHGPFIRALVARYESAGPLPELLWIALGWMQNETTFDETRFLTGMTALEAIVDGQLTAGRGTVISKSDFKELREQLSRSIVSETKLTDGQREIFLRKISQLNARTLSQRINALFDQYEISQRDFEGDVIQGLINLRNSIVHTGVSPEGLDLWPSIVLVRELITRILLKEIGFIGRYCCYVGGLNDRDFP